MPINFAHDIKYLMARVVLTQRKNRQSSLLSTTLRWFVRIVSVSQRDSIQKETPIE